MKSMTAYEGFVLGHMNRDLISNRVKVPVDSLLNQDEHAECLFLDGKL